MEVTTVPSRLGSSGFLIQNLGPDDLYVGEANVSESNGFQVKSGAAITIGDTAYDVYVVSVGTSEVQTLGEGMGLYSKPVIPDAPDLSGYETTSAHNSSQSAAISALSSVYQPLDSDLTAIAALGTTSYGRALLTLANAGAADWTTDAELAAAVATLQPLDADLTAIAALTTTSYGRALLTLANAAAADWVAKSLFDANTILVANSDDTPLALTVAASTVLGRKASGNIAAMSAAEAAAVLGTNIYGQVQTANPQTGTTYTLVAADAGKLVTLNNASAITLTLPQDSDATIAVLTYIDLLQLGAGQVTVVAGTGATLRTSGLTAKARAQYSRLGVQKISANTWSLFGDLATS